MWMCKDVCVVSYGCTDCCCFQAEDGIRDLVRSRGLGDVYKRQLSIVSPPWNRRSKGVFFLDKHLFLLLVSPDAWILSLIHL